MSKWFIDQFLAVLATECQLAEVDVLNNLCSDTLFDLAAMNPIKVQLRVSVVSTSSTLESAVAPLPGVGPFLDALESSRGYEGSS